MVLGLDRLGGVRDASQGESRPIHLQAATWVHADATTTLVQSVTVADAVDRILLVAVMVGGPCGTLDAQVIGVTFGGQPLTPLASIVGTPCGSTSTRSEQWILVSPAVGTSPVVVTLSLATPSLHSAAMALENVDQTQPVRATQQASGVGTLSMVTVASALDDLVVNTVGQGSHILAPADGSTTVFLGNVDSTTTLNNSAGSTRAGSAPSVTSTWSFGADDEWQTISTSFRPNTP